MLSVFAVLVAFASLNNTVNSALIQDSRIIGGTDTNIENIPWQAAILYNGEFVCGGSIIDANRILTAAHCIFIEDPTQTLYSVRVGATKTEFDGQIVNVLRIHVHENYNFPNNDIAVIILETPLKFDKKVQSIKLPSNSEDLKEGTEVMVSGWGHTEHHFIADKLQMVIVEIVVRQKCWNLLQQGLNSTQVQRSIVNADMICAGTPTAATGETAVCNGDSGSPMVSMKDKVLHGIVSWGYGCARPDKPGVYVRVAAHLKWIEKQR